MYLLDSNVFIEAKNRYYADDIFPGFWKWIDLAAKQKTAHSITQVYDELKDGEDALAKWVRARNSNGLFLDVGDESTQIEFRKIANYVSKNAQFNDHAKLSFLKGADPWLIAKAKSEKATVVTHELLNNNSKKSIKIPNICKYFQIPYMNTFEMLRELTVSFGLMR